MFERIKQMFDIVAMQGHGSIAIVLLIGFIFGIILLYTRIDKFEKIAGFAMLEDTTVPKMLLLTIGLSSIGLYFLDKSGYIFWHIKPLILGGLVFGGVLFGIAMAILGKCPGTGPISIAEGRIDVLIGAIGGIFGGLFFTMNYDFFQKINVINLGKLTLPSFFSGHEIIVVLLYGILMVVLSILIPNVEYIDKLEEEALK